MTELLDGEKLSQKLFSELKEKIAKAPRPPSLAFIIVGKNPASEAYVRMKQKASRETGIKSHLISLKDAKEEDLLIEIQKLNDKTDIDGILVQLPLPTSFSIHRVLESIDPTKDVDGFHPMNMGRLLAGDPQALVACTPKGIQMLLNHYGIPLSGKHVVILGRSNIVGKPLAALLMQKNQNANATVTIANSASENLLKITQSADVLIAAIGHPRFVKKEMIRPQAVVVDVGFNRLIENGKEKIMGDVDFEGVFSKASYITPVPKGIGPMTIAALMQNTYQSFLQREKLDLF